MCTCASAELSCQDGAAEHGPIGRVRPCRRAARGLWPSAAVHFFSAPGDGGGRACCALAGDTLGRRRLPRDAVAEGRGGGGGQGVPRGGGTRCPSEGDKVSLVGDTLGQLRRGRGRCLMARETGLRLRRPILAVHQQRPFLAALLAV